MMSFTILDNANLIIPETSLSGSLWLGNYKSALEPDFFLKNNISVVVNCSVDLPYIYDVIDVNSYGLSKLETFRIPVYDSLLDHDIYIMEQYFHTVIPFIIKKLLKEHKNILVHCRAGAQRSAIVTAAVLFVLVDNNLIEFKNLQKDNDKSTLIKNTIKYILRKRPRAFSYGFRVNFKKSIESFFGVNI
jgi:hypothetical protein